eukprot:m.19530 g.19530  ORF g.19530 m.19530 type:complete len:139 (-) comp5130_c0_seq1:207-623(-)
MLTDLQKIGIGLNAFGLFFLFLGMILFFDHGLLAIGNILFVSGLSCIIGLGNTFTFFFQATPQKIKGSVLFFGGILTILWFSSIIGMLLEGAGLFFLFGGFIPVILGFLRRLPVVSIVFTLPIIGTLLGKLEGQQLPL